MQEWLWCLGVTMDDAILFVDLTWYTGNIACFNSHNSILNAFCYPLTVSALQLYKVNEYSRMRLAIDLVLKEHNPKRSDIMQVAVEKCNSKVRQCQLGHWALTTNPFYFCLCQFLLLLPSICFFGKAKAHSPLLFWFMACLFVSIA